MSRVAIAFAANAGGGSNRRVSCKRLERPASGIASVTTRHPFDLGSSRSGEASGWCASGVPLTRDAAARTILELPGVHLRFVGRQTLPATVPGSAARLDRLIRL